MFIDLSLQVSTFSELHHNAKCARRLVKKSFFVANNIFVAVMEKQISVPKKNLLDGGENSNFIKRIFLFFFREPLYFDLHNINKKI